MLTWVSIIWLLKCLTLSTHAKTNALTFHPHSRPSRARYARPYAGACSRRLLKYTSIRAQSCPILALSWSTSAWAGEMRDQAPEWRVWRATDPYQWPSQGTRPSQYRQRNHRQKRHCKCVSMALIWKHRKVKSYPAPLVSLILSSLIAWTETSLTSALPPSEAVTAIVGSVPCVKTTVLGL